jgi:hypothetical protein
MLLSSQERAMLIRAFGVGIGAGAVADDRPLLSLLILLVAEISFLVLLIDRLPLLALGVIATTAAAVITFVLDIDAFLGVWVGSVIVLGSIMTCAIDPSARQSVNDVESGDVVDDDTNGDQHRSLIPSSSVNRYLIDLDTTIPEELASVGVSQFGDVDGTWATIPIHSTQYSTSFEAHAGSELKQSLRTMSVMM